MSTGLQILYHDKQVIPYRRELRPLLGSVNATILFQEAVYLHGLKNEDFDSEIKPFYMFRIPAPGHDRYTAGQSWVELLGFSPREFDGAIKKIGTKISIRKDDPLEVLANALNNADPRGLIVYWTNADRMTYYLLNVPLAELVVEFSYNIFQQKSDWTWEDARRQFKDFVSGELEKANQQKRNYVIAENGDPNQQKRNYVINKSAITYFAKARLVINKEVQKDIQKDIQKNKQQHASDQGDLITENAEKSSDAVVVAEDFSLEDAFRLAGIKARTAKRIPDAWKGATGEDITPDDVLAWHFYREAENLNLPAGRKLRPAFVIASLEAGDRADEEFYERAREYLADLQAEQAVEDLDASAEPDSPELSGLRRALEAYVPPVAEIGIEALDAMSRRLPEIAKALHARGVTPVDLNDLHLYLAYTGQSVPRPEDVAETLAGAGPDFQSWRERKAEAERLWRHIVQQSNIARPGSAIDQAMKRAMPVDLNGSLVVMGSTDLQLYFQRIWPRKAAAILSETDFPKDLPIQFIPQ